MTLKVGGTGKVLWEDEVLVEAQPVDVRQQVKVIFINEEAVCITEDEEAANIYLDKFGHREGDNKIEIVDGRLSKDGTTLFV